MSVAPSFQGLDFRAIAAEGQDLEKVFSCLQASTYTKAHWWSRSIWKLASSSQDMGEGGCSQMPTPPLETTALNKALPRS